jgi:alginate O-acetyltransferase complex protein AlgI
LRNRLYEPLGRAMARWGRYSDIYVVFLISGVWHGANWTFIIWGLMHATYMVVSLATKKLRTRTARFVGLTRFPTFHKWLKIFIVFNLVSFAWIFFRAKTVEDAFYIISNLGVGLNLQSLVGPQISLSLGTSRTSLLIAGCLILVMELIHLLQERGRLRPALARKPFWYRWALYYTIVAAIIFLGEFSSNQFIYFQF